MLMLSLVCWLDGLWVLLLPSLCVRGRDDEDEKEDEDEDENERNDERVEREITHIQCPLPFLTLCSRARARLCLLSLLSLLLALISASAELK